MQAEWVILAVIVVVLASKFISILGKERVPKEKMRFISQETGQIFEMIIAQAKEQPTNKEFDEKDFLKTVQDRFHAVVNAFANADTALLKSSLSSDVFSSFSKAIEKRQKAGQKMEFSLICIDSSKIIEHKKSPLKITVEFISEQVNVLRDAAGNVLEGDPMFIGKVVDTWTFEKKKGAKSAWIVTATKSEALNA